MTEVVHLLNSSVTLIVKQILGEAAFESESLEGDDIDDRVFVPDESGISGGLATSDKPLASALEKENIVINGLETGLHSEVNIIKCDKVPLQFNSGEQAAEEQAHPPERAWSNKDLGADACHARGQGGKSERLD